MIDSRKLTFQLTPLLDLLLIVIFAQYLDVETSTRKETVQLTASRELVSRELDAAVQQILSLKTKIDQLEAEVDVTRAQSAEGDRYRIQRDLIGEMVAEMFQIPETVLVQLLQRRSAAGPGPSANDSQQMQDLLKKLTTESPQRVVDHLLTFGEMRKRIDIWELYLSENGQLMLTAGDKRFDLRAETTEDIGVRLFEAYKSLPEPKSMVLILLTYGDVRFRPLKATLDGMPTAIERMRMDAGGRARFEYAVLGYRPQPLDIK